MAGIIEITCDRCDYRQRQTERGHQYRFPGKRTALIEQTLAWCKSCQRVVEAEQLPGVVDFDEQITEVNADTEWVREWLRAPRSTAEAEVQRLQESKAWRLARQAPPKCLECGSTSIEAFVQDENGSWRDIQHADCGGRLRAGYVGHALVREWPLQQYSPEGDFLTELLNEDEWRTCDVDTLGAIVGALAGARLGVSAIPSHLGETVLQSEKIQELAFRFHALAMS